MWFLEITKEGENPFYKPYDKASLAVEAIAKAETYYKQLKESVQLCMKSNQGHLILTINTLHHDNIEVENEGGQSSQGLSNQV